MDRAMTERSAALKGPSEGQPLKGPSEGQRSVALDLETIFASEYKKLVALAYALTGALSVAEDIVQETFAAAHRKWELIRNYDLPSAWLRKVVVNQAASHRRRRRREIERDSVLVASEMAEEHPGASDDSIWHHVRALPKRQRQLVALVYVDQITVKKAAETLGISEPTAKTHLQRARATLAGKLKLAEDEDEYRNRT